MSNPHPQGHENTDLSLKPIITFVVALGIVAVIVHFSLGFFMSRFQAESNAAKKQIPPLSNDMTGQFPPPNTPVEPRKELAKHLNREREVAESYGWTNRDTGIARVPLDRAIEILAERGLPKVKNIEPKGAKGPENP